MQHVKRLLIVIGAVSLGWGFGVALSSCPAKADNVDAWTQRDVQRLIRAQEDQAQALRDILAQLRRTR